MRMRGNLQMRDANNGESERINRSVSEHLFMALKKTAFPVVEDLISKGWIHIVQQVIDDSFGKVKDGIHLMVEEKLIYQSRNSRDEATTLVPRDFALKFLDQVSDPVLTGKVIRGKEGTDIKIAIVDKVTGVPVDSGPQSSAKVEIFILDASVEDFDDSIIIANNKPHIRKRVFVNLEKGVGILPKNVKLAHRSRWTKSCECRLGARVVKNLGGSRIKEALTDSFTVLDSRSILNKKHDQPSLFDDVWRLKNIGKDGARCNRLREKNVSTVQEFLFLLDVDPQRLQEIFGASPGTWKSTVDHALKCDIDDKKMYLHYSSSSEYKKGVVFNVVGQLKGVLRNGSYVPIETVAENEKDDARKLLAYAFENQKEAPASENKKKASAFENWNYIASFDDEASLLCEFPSITNDKNATISSWLDCPDGYNSSIVENIDPTKPVTSSQGISPSINDSNSSSCWPSQCFKFDFGNNDKIPRVESYSDHQSCAGSIRFVGFVIIILWLLRVKKRVATSEDAQVHKRQRQS